MTSKSVLANMRKNDLLEFKITLPKNKNLINTLKPLFDTIDNLNNTIKKKKKCIKII